MATSDQRTIPWVIEPQTQVKHALLRQYIPTWMKILWQQQVRMRIKQQLAYVDGFAGPGEYWETDEKTNLVPGSPIIVGSIANDLIDADQTRCLHITAIDTHPETVTYLKPRLEELDRHNQKWAVHQTDFSTGTTSFLNNLVSRGNPPTFFFVDPFGYSGFPMNLLGKIMSHPRMELFITFMAYDILRFIEEPAREPLMIELYGNSAYKAICDCKTRDERIQFITRLYNQQLRTMGGAKFVTIFRVNTPDQGTRPKYFLFHASNNITALKEMKNAMAKTSDERFRFEAIGLNGQRQLSLFDPLPEDQIKQSIYQTFSSGQKEIPYINVEDWAYENTAGIAKDIKAALIELEAEKKLEVVRLPRQRKNTVTEGAVLKFHI